MHGPILEGTFICRKIEAFKSRIPFKRKKLKIKVEILLQKMPVILNHDKNSDLKCTPNLGFVDLHLQCLEDDFLSARYVHFS